MKKVTIGKQKYEQCNTVAGFVRGFDNESKADMLITLHNYVTGLNQIKDDFDPDQMVYALITFEKDEDRNLVDETKLKEKIEKWSSDGLTQGLVEETTRGFIQASTTHFVSSLQTNLETEMQKLED